MIFGAILAGGTGTRMNMANGLPKQFLMLGEKPIIIHTIEKFLLCEKIDVIYIGVHKSWITYMEDIVEKYLNQKEKIKIVSGGTDRNGTIMNIIDAIEKEFGKSDENIIITHDAVRPFITLKIIEDNIKAAQQYGTCDTVIPATDTIVISENNEEITKIPNRNFMYQGQTPQSFKIRLLKNLYEDLTEIEKAELTDACKVCVVRNTPVKLVLGDASNIKITTISDYEIAKALLKEEE